MWKAKVDEESESPLPNCQEASCIPFQETIRIFRNTATKMNMPETLKFNDLWMSSVPPFKNFSFRFRFNLLGLAILAFFSPAQKTMICETLQKQTTRRLLHQKTRFVIKTPNNKKTRDPATSNDLISLKPRTSPSSRVWGHPNGEGGKLGTLLHRGEGD